MSHYPRLEPGGFCIIDDFGAMPSCRSAVEDFRQDQGPGSVLHEQPELPAPVATLDELLLILPKGTPLRFDPNLGFHLYGADLCLQAAELGLAVVAIEVPCQHNTRHFLLPPDFFTTAEILHVNGPIDFRSPPPVSSSTKCTACGCSEAPPS